MNKEDLKVLPIALVGLGTGIGEYFIRRPLVEGARNVGRFCLHTVFKEPEYDYPVSANITYHSTTTLEGE